MNHDENIAGYEDIVTGSREAPAAGSPGGMQLASIPELKSLLAIVVGVVVIAALYFAKEVLIPIMLAVILSFVLSPIVNLIQRLRIWRAPAVILTMLMVLGIIGLVGTLIGTQAAMLSDNAPTYAKTIQTKVQGLQGFATAKLGDITQQLTGGKRPAPLHTAPASIAPPKVQPGSAPAPAIAPGASGQAQPMLVEMAQQPRSPLTLAATILAPVVGPLGTLFLVLIIAIFVLMQKEDLRDRFIRLFGSTDLHRTTLAMDDAGQRLSRYFLSQFAVNTCFGIVITLGLWIIGIPSPAMWGLLAGMLRFVPYIGSALAALAPMALGAAVDPGWSMTVYVALLFLVIEPLTGYVVEPMLYGHSTGLSPVSVIVSAVFWTWVWGPIGLILSTPLTLCLVVMGRYVKSMEFFDVLLGDRPALTPVESFYQRILAGNTDEALAQAEALLDDRSLVDYYDGVFLQGLKLAVADEARGTIDHARTERMTRSVLALIHDLGDHAGSGKTAAPLPATAASSIALACIAGGGPFDDAVSAMLRQVLELGHMPARSIRNTEVSRDGIDHLDLAGIDVIAICCLELTGLPAQLRYLVKRVRQRAPSARIIVGLWAEGEGALSNTDIQKMIGADRYVGSLRAVVDEVVAHHRKDTLAVQAA